MARIDSCMCCNPGFAPVLDSASTRGITRRQAFIATAVTVAASALVAAPAAAADDSLSPVERTSETAGPADLILIGDVVTLSDAQPRALFLGVRGRVVF